MSILIYKITDIKEEKCICEGWILLLKYLSINENSHEK